MGEPVDRCGSKVGWPVGDSYQNVSCVLPLGHAGERQHVGFIKGYARGQQQSCEVRVEWTRPAEVPS